MELYIMLLNKQNKKNQKKRVLIIILVVILLVLITAGVFFFTPIKNKFLSTTTPESPSGPISTVDYSGPTKSDVEESQNAKKKADEEKNNPTSSTPSSAGKKTVPIGVSYADIYNNNLEVRAFVSGIIEGTGTCTVTATKRDVTITESKPAFIDTSTTQCEPIYIAQSRLSSGTWKIVVTFSSPDAQGSSEIIEVAVK